MEWNRNTATVFQSNDECTSSNQGSTNWFDSISGMERKALIRVPGPDGILFGAIERIPNQEEIVPELQWTYQKQNVMKIHE